MVLGKKVAIGIGALEMGRKSPESECGPHIRFFLLSAITKSVFIH